MEVKKLNNLLKKFYCAWINTVENDGIEHAGYLSFLIMLSLFPFLVFFTAIIDPISKLIHINLVATLTEIILDSPFENFIEALKPRIMEITTKPPQSFLTLATIGTIWTASSIFEGMRTALNKAYNIQKPPAYIFRRLLSILEFIIVIGVAFTVVFILVVYPHLLLFLQDYIHIQDFKLFSLISMQQNIMRQLTLYIFGVFFILYIYCFLPSMKINIVKSIPCTIVVLILWTVFSNIFQYYILYFPQINFIYGSIAGVIIALLYFYICSLILIYGAELNSIMQNKRRIAQ